jgi:hypothetical protein
MNLDSGASGSAASGRDRHVHRVVFLPTHHRTLPGVKHFPENRCVSMAEYGPDAERQYCRHPFRLPAHSRVPDGIDPTMKAMEAASGDRPSHSTARYVQLPQLSSGNHPVLPRRNLRNGSVSPLVGGFLPHTGNKAPEAPISPPLRCRGG